MKCRIGRMEVDYNSSHLQDLVTGGQEIKIVIRVELTFTFLAVILYHQLIFLCFHHFWRFFFLFLDNH